MFRNVYCYIFQRHEQLSLKWDQAKYEVRADQYEHLLEKVELQKQLIKERDVLARQKLEYIEQEIKQVR